MRDDLLNKIEKTLTEGAVEAVYEGVNEFELPQTIPLLAEEGWTRHK